MKKFVLVTGILMAPFVYGCTSAGQEGAHGWACTATAETDSGSNQEFSWHDLDKRIALANALESCKQHSTVAGMCTADPANCTPY